MTISIYTTGHDNRGHICRSNVERLTVSGSVIVMNWVEGMVRMLDNG